MENPNQDVAEIIDNARRVKGEDFVKLLRLSGIMHGFCMLSITRLDGANADNEVVERMCSDASIVWEEVCSAYAEALGLGETDMEEALKLLSTIDDKMFAAISKE